MDWTDLTPSESLLLPGDVLDGGFGLFGLVWFGCYVVFLGV